MFGVVTICVLACCLLLRLSSCVVKLNKTLHTPVMNAPCRLQLPTGILNSKISLPTFFQLSFVASDWLPQCQEDLLKGIGNQKQHQAERQLLAGCGVSPNFMGQFLGLQGNARRPIEQLNRHNSQDVNGNMSNKTSITMLTGNANPGF